MPARRVHWRSRGWIATTVAAITMILAPAGLLSVRGQDRFIAYLVPAGTTGNQNFGGVLGMDFDVQNPVLITKLGVFDDGSDGLNLTLIARLWDRATQTELAAVEFTPEDPGELIGGSRFKPLPEPIRLEIGFQGTITAEGYGATEQLRNGFGNPANIVWTTQDGHGSLAFVGSSRWGLWPGTFPGTVDEGPAARYAAGTFEFETTPPLLPGKAVVTAKPGDGQVVLTWTPVTAPLPAARYRVLRAAGSMGPWEQIAEVEGTSYLDGGLTNGVDVCYVVRAVSATGKVGPDSDVRCAAPYVLAPNHLIAYFVPAAAGNQAFGGSLGLDFDVENPIIVKRLGVFDDNADGLKRPLAARIYNRETEEVVAEVLFAPGDGVLVEGMRFKALESPLRLEEGFQGVIQADGYGEEERLLNSHGDTNRIIWTLYDGNGSIRFVGSSRWAVSPGVFPSTIDQGPAARFAAGTFEYEVLPPARPGRPTLHVVVPYEDAAVTLYWDAVTNPLPAVKYRVYRATEATGPFTQVAETATTTYRDTGLPNGIEVFYFIRAVAEGGQESRDSNLVRSTPNPRLAGVAYIVSVGVTGIGTFPGSLGMDFDVARPVRITELGVFDNGADGLGQALTAVLYNRDTREPVATLSFTPENPGTLRDSSRFKPLPDPLVLPAGFKGTIAVSGYGDLEPYFSNSANVSELQVFGGGSLLFVGSGRYGPAGQFPATPDTGPPNRYAAGTFYFEPLPEAIRIYISLVGQRVRITWEGGGRLESAPEVTGPWAEVTGAVSGSEFPVTNTRQFYRVRR